MARWNQMDPADQFVSPYLFAGDAPTSHVDLDGRTTFAFFWLVVAVLDDGRKDIWDYGMGFSAGLPFPIYMGETEHPFSFVDFGNPGPVGPEGPSGNFLNVMRSLIDYRSTWAHDKINEVDAEVKGNFAAYVWNARGTRDYDVKTKTPLGDFPGYGSQTRLGAYGSARDAGNILFGIEAVKGNVGYDSAMAGAGAYNVAHNNFRDAVCLFITQGGVEYFKKMPYYGENRFSYLMQDFGYKNPSLFLKK